MKQFHYANGLPHLLSTIFLLPRCTHNPYLALPFIPNTRRPLQQQKNTSLSRFEEENSHTWHRPLQQILRGTQSGGSRDVPHSHALLWVQNRASLPPGVQTTQLQHLHKPRDVQFCVFCDGPDTWMCSLPLTSLHAPADMLQSRWDDRCVPDVVTAHHCDRVCGSDRLWINIPSCSEQNISSW